MWEEHSGLGSMCGGNTGLGSMCVGNTGLGSMTVCVGQGVKFVLGNMCAKL